MSLTDEKGWAEPRVRELRRLHKEKGLSFRDITNALNKKFNTEFSRNAVIGKAKRIGLVRIETPQPARPRSVSRHRTSVAVAALNHRREAISEAPRRSRFRAEALPEATTHDDYNARSPDKEGIAIDALREDNCHWPLGEWDALPPYQYCGKEKLVGGPLPYCPFHTRLAIKPGRP